MITFDTPAWMVLLITALWTLTVLSSIWESVLQWKIRKIEREIEYLKAEAPDEA